MSRQPFRTLHILSSLQRRGAEICAATLTDGLSRELFRPAIWAIDPIGSEPGVVPARTPVLAAAAGSRRERPLHTLRRLSHAITDYRPLIVHAHGGRALKYMQAARAFLPGAFTCVYTKIGSIHPLLDHPLRRRLYGMLFERVDAIVTVGAALQREVERDFRLRHPLVVTIPTGVDSRSYATIQPDEVAAVRHDMGLNDTDLCLMMVGSLSWEKDPAMLVDLFHKLAADLPQLKMVFVGEGPLAGALRRQTADAGLEGRVRFLGVRSDIPRVISAADIVALPSRTEGLPGVLIEAGFAGRASVAFDVGSVRDVILDGRTGFVVPAGDRTQFEARVLQLVQSSALRKAMGEAAVSHCRTTFDLTRYVRQHEQLFLALLGAREPQVFPDVSLANTEAAGLLSLAERLERR